MKLMKMNRYVLEEEVREMEKIVDVAQYIFNEYKNISGDIIDEMKLHKLLYLCQRESIAITNKAMFPEEFEGWKYGPVCPEVRNCYTKEGILVDNIHDISFENAYIVKNVILQYGAYEPWKLSELSHKELSWRNSRIGVTDGYNGSGKLKIEDIRKDAQKVRPYDSIWDMYYDEFDDMEEI